MLTAAAYGFRIAGGPSGGWLALQGGRQWPRLELESDAGVPLDGLARVDATAWHVGVSAELPEDEVPHPLLGRIVHALAARRGIDVMHGGSVLGRDGAWAVIGDKEAGKSTLLAACARAGVTVLSDDVLALDGLVALAGPRCIDLRPASARILGPGVAVRSGARRRIALPPAPAESELAGVIHLGWGTHTELVRLAPSERLARLAARRVQDRWPRDPTLLLDLARLPAFELRRPKGLSSLEDGAALVCRELLGATQAARSTA